jgi:hypothetical protein
MQNDAAVFRTGETLAEGCAKIDDTVASFGDVKVRGARALLELPAAAARRALPGSVAPRGRARRQRPLGPPVARCRVARSILATHGTRATGV